MIEGFKQGLNPGLITRACPQRRTPRHMTRHQGHSQHTHTHTLLTHSHCHKRSARGPDKPRTKPSGSRKICLRPVLREQPGHHSHRALKAFNLQIGLSHSHRLFILNMGLTQLSVTPGPHNRGNPAKSGPAPPPLRSSRAAAQN